jgi:hypothetical protein
MQFLPQISQIIAEEWNVKAFDLIFERICLHLRNLWQ